MMSLSKFQCFITPVFTWALPGLGWFSLGEEKRLERALIVVSGICQSALRKMEPGFSQGAWWEGWREGPELGQKGFRQDTAELPPAGGRLSVEPAAHGAPVVSVIRALGDRSGYRRGQPALVSRLTLPWAGGGPLGLESLCDSLLGSFCMPLLKEDGLLSSDCWCS